MTPKSIRETWFRNLATAERYDTILCYIKGATLGQLQAICHRAGYRLNDGRIHGNGCEGCLCTAKKITTEEEFGREHELLASLVYEIVEKPWEVQTVYFQAGSNLPTYERLEWTE